MSPAQFLGLLVVAQSALVACVSAVDSESADKSDRLCMSDCAADSVCRPDIVDEARCSPLGQDGERCFLEVAGSCVEGYACKDLGMGLPANQGICQWVGGANLDRDVRCAADCDESAPVCRPDGLGGARCSAQGEDGEGCFLDSQDPCVEGYACEDLGMGLPADQGICQWVGGANPARDMRCAADCDESAPVCRPDGLGGARCSAQGEDGEGCFLDSQDPCVEGYACEDLGMGLPADQGICQWAGGANPDRDMRCAADCDESAPVCRPDGLGSARCSAQGEDGDGCFLDSQDPCVEGYACEDLGMGLPVDQGICQWAGEA